MPFILYRSSAGSGKTFTLVKEYLKIILQKPDEFRHILAITFTNKAAQEMKTRILSNLQLLSGAKSTDDITILNQIVEETKLDRDILIQRSSEALNLILHQYSDFSVTTIDSFMHRVIRTFAHDLRLAIDFEVELDVERWVAMAVDNIVRQAGKNEQLTKALVNFILNKSEDEQGWKIEKDLQEIGNQLFKERGQLAIDTFRQHPLTLEKAQQITADIRQKIKKWEKNTKLIGEQAVALISSESIPFSAFYQGEKGLPKYFQSIASGAFDKIQPGQFVLSTIEQNKWYSSSASQQLEESIDRIKNRLLQLYQNLYAVRTQQYPGYLSLKIIEKNILPLSILYLIDEELNSIKKERNILPIAEFNKRISDSILDEPVPYIYERLGEWYHHYLLDEFQDNSILQWFNLLPLVENSLARNYSCILVGDGKQAIYRWRNGDVEQFTRLPELYNPDIKKIPSEWNTIIHHHYDEKQLKTNFRTASEIVNFNNDFFSLLKNYLGTHQQKIYKDLSQEARDEHPGGYVSIEFMKKNGDFDAFQDDQLTRIREIINQCCEDGYSWKDIAILCRSNDKASKISQFLIEREISVSSSESILLKNSPVVNTLLSCLELIIHPGNSIHHEVVKRYVNEHTVPREEFNIDSLKKYRGMPLYEQCESLVRDLKMDLEPDPFIIFFLDNILQFSRRQDSSISAFLNWWDEKSGDISLKTPEDYNAVRVLTIHKAKGLEFEIVIYPFATETRVKKGPDLWVTYLNDAYPELRTVLIPFEKKLEDSTFSNDYAEEEEKVRLDFLNVLYVAMTRPKERLYVLTGIPGKDFVKGSTTSDLFGMYLSAIGVDPLNTAKFTRGTESKIQQEKRISGVQRMLGSIHSSTWSHRMSVRQNHPEDWDVTDPDKPRDKGILIHRLLSQVIRLEDIENSLSQLLQEYSVEGSLSKDIREFFDHIVATEELHPFFSPEATILTEAEILAPGGKSFRPDRLVLYPEKTMVMDYKTGAPMDSHDKQILHYAELIQGMGYPAVTSYLLYLQNPPMLKKLK